MRKRNTSGTVVGFVGLLSTAVLAQSWTLPHGATVIDKGPRTYRFTVDHAVTDTTGQVVQRQRVSGDYTRGLPGGEAAWSRVTLAESNGPQEISGRASRVRSWTASGTGPARPAWARP